jgi:hypothetical protein
MKKIFFAIAIAAAIYAVSSFNVKVSIQSNSAHADCGNCN